MKSWLSKFKISAALDAEPSPSSPNRKGSAGSDAVRGFAESVQSVDRGLRSHPPDFESPPDLDFAIMNEVRQAARTSSAALPKRKSRTLLRSLPAAAMATLALVVAWWIFNRPATSSLQNRVANRPSLEVGPALELGANAARDIPPVVVGPLSDELDRMNADLDNAAKFLLSSLP